MLVQNVYVATFDPRLLDVSCGIDKQTTDSLPQDLMWSKRKIKVFCTSGRGYEEMVFCEVDERHLGEEAAAYHR